jgi:hypothetical protein
MAPTMDIDKTDTSAEEEDAAAKSSTAAAAAVTTANSKSKKKSGSNNPSASSETASLHPDMALAQDIHRLTMIHTGKLSIDDATTSIIGCLPQELLDKVMARVGTGGKSLEEAMMENEAKYKPNSGSAEGDNKETATTAKVDDKNSSSSTTTPEPLLNPSLYRHLQSTLSYYHSPSALTDTQLQTLTSHHESMIQAFNDAITKAKDEAGDMEVLHAHMDMARYHAKCSTKEEALAAYQAAISLPKLSVGKKLDAHLEMARVCSFYSDYKRMKETLSEAAKATAKGGDWDRRNRLKVYQALNFILVRDMESASKLLVEGIATFSCTELCDYSEFIVYAIITALLNLKRTELKKCIIDGSEVLQVAKDIPVVVSCLFVMLLCNLHSFRMFTLFRCIL